ncbi:MAG: hypothetical protein QGI83_04425 [Candidatus Latescibacteria bacterium]|nr:hypothetical protein [Candidatus Latescibacterota bacterium]
MPTTPSAGRQDIGADGLQAGPDQGRGLTGRAVILGLLATCVMDMWIIYSDYTVHSSRFNLTHFPMALLTVFLLVLFVVNPILKTRSPGTALSPGEILVILAMGYVGAAIPASGLTGILLGVIAPPYYFATPENQWAEYLHEHIPRWIAPTDAKAMGWFWQGMPRGAGIPWDVWFVPLAWWFLFIGAVFLVSACIVVVMRRQWSDNERLLFPLAAVPIEMVQEDRGRRLPAITREKLFWPGFGIALAVPVWNFLGYFITAFPQIPLQANLVNRHWRPFGRLFPRLNPEVSFFVIGFAFFANLDVLLSVWLFGALGFAQTGVLHRIGFPIGREGYDATDWECFGALFVVVSWGVWVSRTHLRAVWKAACRGTGDGCDESEILSYRAAVVGFILGSAFVLGWLHHAGIELWVLAVLYPTLIVIYLGMTRFVAETGFVFANAPVSEDEFLLDALGSANLGPGTVTAMAFERSIYSYGKALFTPALAHAAKLGEAIGEDRRRLFGAIVAALIVGLVLSVGLTIYLGYATGASNFNDTPMRRGLDGFRRAVRLIRNPAQPEWNQIGFLGVGTALTVLLLFLRSRFPWWPVNPIGLIVGGSYWAHFYLTSIFLAWFSKFAILKTGGATLYQRFRPFYLGLVVGYALGILVMFIMDVIWFPGSGHRVHTW